MRGLDRPAIRRNRGGAAPILVRWSAVAATILLVACGGGGDGGGATASAGLQDATPYSTAPAGALTQPNENAAVTSHAVVVDGRSVAYTATAGHLTALAPTTRTAEASMFYVAYTVARAPGTERPIVFFYNGGPGSATVWLHLGSFAPRRIVTHAPSLAIPQPYQLVDNAESLIDVADLVFVDAVGTGYSTAVAPSTNQNYWSVDRDAAVMGDFIARYAEVNGRGAAPTFIYGESYGTTRSAVLAQRMVAAGMRLDGVVLQSSILDYNSNCGVLPADTVSCEGTFPSYGMVGAWFARTLPVPADGDAYAEQLRGFSAATYGPAARAWIETRTPAAAALLAELVNLTGAPLAQWTADVNLDPTTFRETLLAGLLLGAYDARIAAPDASALARSGDPSSALIAPSFTAAARSLFVDELQYVPSAPYVLLSSANANWDYGHDGRALPDTVPDLGAALAQRPGLRVLSIAGYHDLATPFHQTELDLARLGVQAGITARIYAGGHMTYLDDGSRPRIKAALAAFIAGSVPIPAEAAVDGQGRAAMQAAMPATAGPATAGHATAGPAIAGPAIAGPATAGPAIAGPATAATTTATLAIDRSALAQGGGPWLPPALRATRATPSPRGEALRALIERKIAERGAESRR